MARLFVGNISFNSTADQFKAHVQHVPGIVEVDFKMENDRPRGIAFLQCDSPASADKARAMLDGSKFAGRAIAVKEGAPRTGPSRVNGGRTELTAEERDEVLRTGQLCVTGVAGLTEDDIQSYFSTRARGGLTCHIARDEAGRPRDIAFVTYSNPKAALFVLTDRIPHTLQGRSLRVLPRPSDRRKSAGATTVHITGPATLNEDSLKTALQPLGRVVSLRVLNPNPDGHAVVQFADPQTAHSVHDTLDGKEIAGHVGVLHVSINAPPTQPASPAPASTPQADSAVGADSGVVQFFHSCVYRTGSPHPQPWQACGNLTYQHLLERIEEGADAVGNERARLVHLWSILIQDSDRPDAHRFTDPFRVPVTFLTVFVQSQAIEKMVLAAVRSPWSAPISPGTLPAACKLSVFELVIKILSKSLVGSPQLHHDLAEAADKLARLSEVLPPGLPHTLATLFGCFKISSSDSSVYDMQLDTISSEIIKAQSAQATPFKLLGLHQEKWRLLLRQIGMGGDAEINHVYQTLSAELDKLHASLDHSRATHRSEVTQADSELAQLQDRANAELNPGENAISRLDAEAKGLVTQREQVDSELRTLDTDLHKLRPKLAALDKTRRQNQPKASPELRQLVAQKAALESQLNSAGQVRGTLERAAEKLDNAHAFLYDALKRSKLVGPDTLDTLQSKTFTAAMSYLASLREDLAKVSRKWEFCAKKLRSMQTEYEEMRSLDFGDAANDVLKGVEKMKGELQKLWQEGVRVSTEAGKLVSWLQALSDSGMLTQDMSTINELHSTMEAMQQSMRVQQ